MYLRYMEQELFSSESQFVNIITIAIVLLLFMAVAIVLFFYFSRKKIIQTQLEKANLEISHQKEILQSAIITQEEERKRIAQDLHDAISSKLNVVSLNASILTEEDIEKEESNKIGASILKITNTVLESSRQIAHDLLPPTLEKFGLKAALEELCEEILETKKFSIIYNLKYAESQLDSNQELHLFRIVQELINNSIKHSEASEITLSLQTEKNHLSLRYSDNGKGFNVEEKKKAKGLGMSGIENRVIILKGKLTLKSEIGKGMSIIVDLKQDA